MRNLSKWDCYALIKGIKSKREYIQLFTIRRIKAQAYIIYIVSMFSLFTQAQPAYSQAGVLGKNIKALEVGDTIPEVFWKMQLMAVNHSSSDSLINLQTYKSEKLIILDFWATWCGSCIANMPLTHRLESEIEGVAFIPVTFEPKKKVASFIRSNEITSSINVFSIVEDGILNKYFPHQYLPHYVWITTDGIIRAITDGREVNQVNIKRMLASPTKMKLVKPQEMNDKHALLISDDVVDGQLKYYSLLIKGIRPEYTLKFFQRSRNGIVYGRCHTNGTLKSMYALLVNEMLAKKGIYFNMTKDIIINVKEPKYLDFTLSDDDKKDENRQELKYKWEADNLYSYDVILPIDKAPQLYDHILTLLNDSTPYSAKIEKRNIGGKEKFMLVIEDDQK